jgi:hypothetical protein
MLAMETNLAYFLQRINDEGKRVLYYWPFVSFKILMDHSAENRMRYALMKVP